MTDYIDYTDTGHGHHPFVRILSWTSNALAEHLKEKRNRMSSTVTSGERGGAEGGEDERGDGGGEEKKIDGEGMGEKGDGGGSNDSNRNHANISGSLGGSLNTGTRSGGKDVAGVRPGDGLDNIDYGLDGEAAGHTKTRNNCSKGDYLAQFKVRIPSWCSCD